VVVVVSNQLDLAVLHLKVVKNLPKLSNQLAESCQMLQQNVWDPDVLHLEVMRNLHELAGSCQMLQKKVLDLAVHDWWEPMDLPVYILVAKYWMCHQNVGVAVQHLGVIWQEPSALQLEQPLEVAWTI
jgi:hypothetical protein